MVKVVTRKILSAGRGISLPPSWIKDQGLQPKDLVDIYRDDEDRLILVPVKSNPAQAEAALAGVNRALRPGVA